MGEQAGFNHEDPNFLTEDSEKLRAYIARRNSESELWGFKMPKATMNLDFFEETLRNPIYIVAYRNPLAIADSWIQRKAGDLHGVLRRIQEFNNELNRLYVQTEAAVLLVNYERAVQNKDTQARFVDELATYLRLKIDQKTRTRAVGMVTGDGGGYTNLPEHYFAATDAGRPAPGTPLALVEQGPDPRDADKWIHQDRMKPRVVLKMADGSNLPKRFRLRITFEHGEGTRSPDGSLRMFFRYNNDFINAHCLRPVFRDGLNVLDIETSGRADAMAFGPWKLPCRYRMKIDPEEIPKGAVLNADACLNGNVRQALSPSKFIKERLRRILYG